MKVVINPVYKSFSEFIDSLNVRFDAEGELIYTGRNIVKRFDVNGISFAVKSFKIPHIVNKVAYTYLRKSKACRSYEHALRLLALDCPTPEPVAYLEEYRNGMLSHSYYVCLFETEAVNAREYLSGSHSDSDSILHDIACFSYKLHRTGILHMDYSLENIMVRETEEGKRSFSLIDINRLRFKELSLDEALYSLDRFCVSEEISARFAIQYAGCCSLEERQDEFIKKVNEATDRFFGHKALIFAVKKARRQKGKRAFVFGPVQQYILFRNLRMLFFGGIERGFLYEKEKALYDEYVRGEDFRRVWSRKYHYE